MLGIASDFFGEVGWEAMQKMRKAKRNAIRAQQGLPPKQPWHKDCAVNCAIGFRETCVRAFCPCCIQDAKIRATICTGGSCVQRMFMEGKHENIMLKSFVGFVGGLALTSVWYFVLVLALSYQPAEALVICTLMGAGLSLGLAFSMTVRCLVFLMLPSMFSSTGRNVLLGILLVMVLSGPMVNFQHNLKVLTETQFCGQQLAYNATQELVDSAMSPLKDMVGSIQQVLDGMLQLSDRLQDALMSVRDLFAEIVGAVDRAFTWLDVMVDMCNESMGGPYQSCLAAFERGENACREALSGFWSFLNFGCDLIDLISHVCHVARILELFCLVTQAITNLVADTISGGVDFVMNDVYNMFAFNVSLNYEYEVTMNVSQSWGEVHQKIQEEIQEILSPLTSVVKWSHVILIVSVLLLFSRALLYRYKFLTKDRYDNVYITTSLKKIDEHREEKEMEQIMPLHWRDKLKYIETTSPQLADCELKKLMYGLLMLGASFLNIFFYLGSDYIIYSLLDMIRRHGDIKTDQQMPSHLRLHIEGEGVLSDMYRSLITQFDPIDNPPASMDSATCLPTPSKPNYDEYIKIGVLFGFCVFLVLTEAYGLRLRHVIVGCYYPKREKERAVWLYNHILRRRGGFLKFLRRKLRSRFDHEEESKKISIVQRMSAQWPLVGKIFRALGMSKDEICLSCAKAASSKDKDEFVHCANNCKAVYCRDCFTDLHNMCTVCLQPIEYGDYSDFSEEKDSSDEDLPSKVPYTTQENLERYFKGELHPSDSKTKPTPATMATFDDEFSSDDEAPNAPPMDRV